VLARSLAILAALATVVAGCAAQKDSSSKFSGAKRPVAQAIEDLQSAGQKGDSKKICSKLLAASVVRRITTSTKTCDKIVKQQLDDADTFELTVVSVSLDGTKAASATHATARVKSTDNGKDRFDLFTLVKEAGRWKIQSLGGV
jgi:outer membrane PBP1 activator LpoA protein